MTPPSWRRVAQHINERMNEIGIDQAELVRRSASLPTVRALMEGNPRGVPRKATLQKVSRGLEWTPDSIERILDGQEPIVRTPVSDDTMARIRWAERKVKEEHPEFDDALWIKSRFGETYRGIEGISALIIYLMERGASYPEAIEAATKALSGAQPRPADDLERVWSKLAELEEVLTATAARLDDLTDAQAQLVEMAHTHEERRLV